MISDPWTPERRFAMPRLLPRRLRSLHTLALVLVVALFGWLGWLWYRGSSFVKVEQVTVTGLSGPDVPQIRDALTATALRMTTLNMDIRRLESAVSAYTFVQRLTVTGRGAHGVVIHVDEQVPVAWIDVAGTRKLVDADGRLLPASVTARGPLPVVPLAAAPAGSTIAAAGARAAVAVLAAAPYALLAHISSATSSVAHGVIVQLRHGPQLYFGPTTQLQQKWNSAVAVLQNSSSVGAAYIDLTDPRRPAPGVGISGSQAIALGLAAPATTSTAGSTGNQSTAGG